MNLAFSNIAVEYSSSDKGGESLVALENLSLTVGSGESVAVIGPSGCGKSTLLRLASGLLAPTSGAVEADGARVEGPRRGTALILQDYGLLPWKTVRANAELGLTVQRVARAERRRRAEEALAAVGLERFADAYPSELSGGMQQRLALARAMAMDADLLLMDEPLSALDALLREEIQDMLLRSWRERGYSQILVTHSIEEAVFLGRRIVVMAPRPGRIVAELENPEMGRADYRSSEAFFERCRAVRAALERGTRGGGPEADAASGGVADGEAGCGR